MKQKFPLLKERFFHSAYTEDRYTAPLVLIKETDSLSIVFWNKEFITYRDKIVGIHTPQSQVSDSHNFYEFLISNHALYQFVCTLNGTRSLVGKSTSILKQDIDILPYPEEAEEISLSFWEKSLCEDALEYMTSYVRHGQNSKLLKTAAEEQALRNYSRLFIRMLVSLYDNLKASAPVFLDSLICQPFYFGERPNLEWLAEYPETELRKLNI